MNDMWWCTLKSPAFIYFPHVRLTLARAKCAMVTPGLRGISSVFLWLLCAEQNGTMYQLLSVPSFLSCTWAPARASLEQPLTTQMALSEPNGLYLLQWAIQLPHLHLLSLVPFKFLTMSWLMTDVVRWFCWDDNRLTVCWQIKGGKKYLRSEDNSSKRWRFLQTICGEQRTMVAAKEMI